MQFVAVNRWRMGLVIALALFVITRAATLMSFPIFNDEAIYLQYSQLIHADWAANKFVSMHGDYHDWKPPLQYWLAAPFIRWGNDPLLVGRCVAAVVSLVGFFGFYLFANELLGEREGTITAWLYVLCPPIVLHNSEFIAETFLFSTAPILYFALLRAMARRRRWWLWAIFSLAAGVALLLFKQAGMLLLGVSICLPFALLRHSPENAGASSARQRNWREFGLNCLVVAAVIICAHFIASAVLPSEFNDTKEHFNSNWVMSPAEILTPPLSTWETNLGVVSDYVSSYYSWLVPALFGAFVYLACRRRQPRELALAAMCFAGGIATCFLLRTFNEYIFNTAIIAALLPSIARAAVLISEFTASRSLLVRGGAVALAAIMALFWCYQITLMAISPGRYIERSTPWAIKNYLRGWPTGFGLKEVVAILEREKRPGVIFADAQWGNPRTALEVYAEQRFPNLRVVPVIEEFTNSELRPKIIANLKAEGPARFAIFSADASAGRTLWQMPLQRELCHELTPLRVYPTQVPIVICRF